MAMNQQVKAMIDDIIKREGGYVYHKDDKGGPTKYGITLKTLEAWRDEKDLYSEDIRLLSKSEASEIYEDMYYSKPSIGLLPELIQPVVFDMAVNMGPKAAIKLMQNVITRMGSPIVIDGEIGPRTSQSAMIACNVYGFNVVSQICAARIEFYRDIVKRDASQKVFLQGWVNRANSFLV